MTLYTTHTFHEADDFEIVAVIEFHIEAASGDGWNEPREDACAIIDAVTLERHEIKGHFVNGYGHPPVYKKEIAKLGPAPDWVIACLASNEILHDELMDQGGDDGPDPDDARDRAYDDSMRDGL